MFKVMPVVVLCFMLPMLIRIEKQGKEIKQEQQAAKEHRDAIDKAVIKHLGEQKWREMQQK